MKRFLPYMFLSVASMVVSVILSKVLSFSLANTWQGLLALVPIFGPYYVYAWKTSQRYERKSMLICFFLRFFIIMAVICHVTTFFVVLLMK